MSSRWVNQLLLSLAPECDTMKRVEKGGSMSRTTDQDDEARERRQHWLQVLAFFGALVVMTTVLYSSILLRDKKKAQERRDVTSTVQQQAVLTAAPQKTAAACGTAQAEDRFSRQSTPLTMPRRAIDEGNAEQLQLLARWGKGLLLDIEWSPDGHFLAMGTATGVYLYDPRLHQDAGYLETGAQVWEVAISPDGQTLAASLVDGQVQIWRAEDCTLERVITTIDPASGADFSPDGTLLVAGEGQEHEVWLWQEGTTRILRGKSSSTGKLVRLALSRQGDAMAAGWDDGVVELWRVTDDGLVIALQANVEKGAQHPAFSPDGQYLASGSDDMVHVWNVQEGVLMYNLGGHNGANIHATFSPDSQVLVTADDESLRFFRSPSGLLLKRVIGRADLRQVVFSPDGLEVAVAQALDGTVQIRQVEGDRLIDTLQGYGAPIKSIMFSPDGQLLASGTLGGAVNIWQVEEGFPKHALQPLSLLSTGAVAFSPDGRLLAVGTENAAVALWDVESGLLTHTLAVPGTRAPTVLYIPPTSGSNSVVVSRYAPIYAVAFSPDSRTLAAGWEGGKILFWRLADHTLDSVLETHMLHSDIESLAFSPDGKFLAAIDSDGAVWLWQVETKRLLRTLVEKSRATSSIAFSPSGQTLACATDDAVHFWRSSGQAALHSLPESSAAAGGIAFSPDGQVLAAGYEDGLIRLWRIQDGECLLTLPAHTSSVVTVAFSPDGRLLATGSYDGTVRVWGVK